MSETDDTDVLLLIPPNFFVVPSDQESDSDIERSTDRVIVGNLISHVNNLESRVNNIENFASSLSDFDNTSIVLNDEPRNKGDILNSSQFPLIESKLGLKQSDILDINDPSFNSLSNKTLLEEVVYVLDNKFSSLLCGKDMDQVSTMDALFQSGSPTKRLALPEVDKLLKEMEITQTEIENKLRMREIEHGIIQTSDKNKHQSEILSRKIYTTGDNVGSIPDRGFGVRDMFANSVQSSPNKSTSNNNNSIEEPCVKRDAFLVGSSNSNDEFRKSFPLVCSPLKDYTSSTKINPFSTQETRRKSYLSPRRRLQMNSDNGNGRFTGVKSSTDQRLDLDDRTKLEVGGSGDSEEIRFKPDGGYTSKTRTFNNPRSNLLSLADLWRCENDLNLEDPTKLKQKLEEEKYRRLHLENTVQTLQRRVLEEQEKLAVAVKVDEGKDRAIGQITEAWKQMVQHWRQIEAERHAMSQTLITERSEISKQKEDIEKKISRWEKEMSQALDLAAGFKIKCEHFEKEITTLKEISEKRIKELEETIVEQDAAIEELKDERKSLAERLQFSKNEHEEEKRLVESLRRDISILQEQLSKSEAELIVVKELRDSLTIRIKEEKSRSSMLDAQKTALTEALDIANEKLAKTEGDVKTITSTLEKSKSELRAVYQSQLESVVRDKVAEFQSQLDRAQATMQIELENNRRKAEEMARNQQQALINSHVVEMRRLESIHKEEIKILENKLVESERGRARLENGKKDIAQRLHGVMESQWRQALNIITSELSSAKQNDRAAASLAATAGVSRVAVAGTTDDDHFNQNLGERSTNTVPPVRRRLSAKSNCEELPLATSILDSETTNDETHFYKDGLLTSRSNVPAIKQPQLLNYIQTLLERQPGRPVDTTSSTVNGGPWPDTTATDTTDEHIQHWAQVIQNNPVILSAPTDNLKQSSNLKKPPWKPT